MSRPRLVLILLSVSIICIAALALSFDFVPAPLQAPRVVQIEPANDATEILLTSPITITFSAPMDPAQTDNAVTLNPRVPGNMFWRDAQTLIFVPKAHLPISTTLTLTVSPNARSWIQRPLQNQTESRFTTLARPIVVSSTPALDAQFVYVPDHVTIVFSRAMDGNTLADSLVVDPTPENFSFALEQTKLTVTGFFEPHIQYHITIPEFEFDAKYNLPLGRDYVWAFTVAQEYPNFSILNRGRVLKFKANDPVKIPTQFTNVSRLDTALYPISQQVFDENASAPFETWYVFQPATAPIQTSSVNTHATLDNYTQQDVLLDALPQGTYYLKITAPEGVSDSQLLLIE